jgi:hypothetical protein
MILHGPRVDEYFLPFLVVLSTNFLVLFTNHLLFYYSSPKISEDAHEFIMKLQQLLLDELEDSKKNPGRTLHGETYVNDLYVSMKAFWDLSQERSHMSIHAHHVKLLFKIRN